jgi:LruC domain-containing protein
MIFLKKQNKMLAVGNMEYSAMKSIKFLAILSLTLLLIAAVAHTAKAQKSVTAVNTMYNSVTGNVGNYTEDGLNYNFNAGSDNNLLILDVEAGGRTYVPALFANRIEMQRVSINEIPIDRQIYFYEGSVTGNDVNLKPSFLNTMKEVLLNPTLNRGVDNIFQNVRNGDGNVNNVMRLDFIFDNGILIPSGTDDVGFTVHERGGNDPITIAAITSLDANGNPASYGPVVRAAENQWGQSGISLKTLVLRKPDSASNAVMTANLSPQPMTGILFTFEDLGVSEGDMIYGYSLAAGDAPLNNNDWLDVNTFPKDTPTKDGGLDIIAGGAYFSSNPVITAVDDYFTTPYETDLQASVAGNDTFQSGSQFVEINQPSNGSVAVNSDGTFNYTPNPGFSGTDQFDYEVCLASPLHHICDTANVTITVEPEGSGITNQYPAADFGTLAFEDLWPSKGDFDFNDMVVDYQFEITSDDENNLQSIEANFILRAFGAGYNNGFGFQLSGDINASDIVVSGSSLTENIVTLSANGTEANQSLPTIIVFDNAYNEMQHPGGGTGVNTTPGAPYVTPAAFTINIDFTGGSYSYEDLDISNFKPFIFVNKERSREIHLPGNAPSDLADMSLFGTQNDDSEASQNRWYVTQNNLPWAINIIDSFEYPTEQSEILDAYLRFTNWAQSGGLAYPDWFSNPSSSYRNESLIYEEN